MSGMDRRHWVEWSLDTTSVLTLNLRTDKSLLVLMNNRWTASPGLEVEKSSQTGTAENGPQSSTWGPKQPITWLWFMLTQFLPRSGRREGRSGKGIYYSTGNVISSSSEEKSFYVDGDSENGDSSHLYLVKS